MEQEKKDAEQSPSTAPHEEGKKEGEKLDPVSLIAEATEEKVAFPKVTHRQFNKGNRIPQVIYLGLEIEILADEEVVHYGATTHDGSYTLDYYEERLEVGHLKTMLDKILFFEDRVIQRIKEYQAAQNYKVHVIALGLRVCNHTCIDYGKERIHTVYGNDAPSLSSRVWLELDAIPFVIRSRGQNLDERASSAIRRAVINMSPQWPGNIPRVSIGYRNEVEVDANSDIHLTDLEHYRDTCTPDTWKVLLTLAHRLKERKLRISFFNSTPQGGGVALMRHALIRLCNRLNVDAHWYVATPSPEVFAITKRKFHNVLQGVAPGTPPFCAKDQDEDAEALPCATANPAPILNAGPRERVSKWALLRNMFRACGGLPATTRLLEEDKRKFLEWTRMNVERHWDDPDGPIMKSDVIIIDDPQLSGVIPWIRKLNPSAKVVYRSHIEIRADLIREQPDGVQAQVWAFLWSAIKQADLFVSHPVDNFIPDCVPRDNVVLMPAATDQLDGLNKELRDWDLQYYRKVFNRLCYDQGTQPVDWKRPFISQVARFDPSKGIPDVLESFRLLRQLFVEAMDQARAQAQADGDGKAQADDAQLLHLASCVPHLIICGHGSVDDPDGTLIYEQAHTILNSDPYVHLMPHVSIVRIPPCDQLLNIALRGATAAMQLSHREGFEVKVTEAISKGIPVVAYNAGGIPFQIRHGETGYLVDVGETMTVAKHLFNLCTDKALRDRMSARALETLSEEYFTVANLVNWMYICLKIVDMPGDSEMATVAAAHAQEQEAGEEEGGDGADMCLLVDGSTKVCRPQLKKPTRNELGGGAWVRHLWLREFKDTFSQSGGNSTGNGGKTAWQAEEENLHPAHAEADQAHRSKKWFLERARQREEEERRRAEMRDMAKEDRG